MMKKNTLTGHEKIALKNIKGAINWVVGGYYNSLQDGDIEILPETLESLKEEIYRTAMNDLCEYDSLSCGRAPKEMRFAGEDFCRNAIDELLENDGDVKEMAEAKGWNNTEETTTETNVTEKENKKMKKNTEKNTVTVALRAFTGMVIGEYEAEQTDKGYKITLKNGKKMTFTKSGKQTGSKGNRFANYIEIL